MHIRTLLLGSLFLLPAAAQAKDPDCASGQCDPGLEALATVAGQGIPEVTELDELERRITAHVGKTLVLHDFNSL